MLQAVLNSISCDFLFYSDNEHAPRYEYGVGVGWFLISKFDIILKCSWPKGVEI